MNNNKFIQFLIVAFVFSSISIGLSSCEKEKEDLEPQEENECVSYSATAASNTINSEWSAPNENDVYPDEITIPGDPGGGYVRVTLSHQDPDLRASLTINAVAGGAAVISGSTIGTNDELVREAYFSVHPGESYTIEVNPFFNANNYPVDYTLEWEFISRVDCWEDNDFMADGKKVLLDDVNEAYAIAGHIEDNVSALADHTYDWYRVEIDEPSRLQVEITDLPKDLAITTRFFEMNNPAQISADFQFTGSDFGLDFDRGRTSVNTTTQELSPGTYYIEIHPDFLEYGRKANNDDDILPEHFDKPYTFIVSTL